MMTHAAVIRKLFYTDNKLQIFQDAVRAKKDWKKLEGQKANLLGADSTEGLRCHDKAHLTSILQWCSRRTLIIHPLPTVYSIKFLPP